MTEGSKRPQESGSIEFSKENLVRFVWFDVVNLRETDKKNLIGAQRDILKTPEAFMDKGGAGSIYRLSSNSELCLKVLHPHKDTEERQKGIDFIAREANITALLNDVQVEGVRSPRCAGYWKGQSSQVSAIVLEHLDALNLQRVLNREFMFPSTFDPDIFLDTLHDYMEYLHDEKKIVHQDLFPRNIMIDIETGLPRVIDFGDAAVLHNMERREAELCRRKDTDRLNELDKILSNIDKT